MSTPANDDPSPRLPSWQAPVICVLLALCVFAVFGQTVYHDFVNFDDNEYVYLNPVVSQGLTAKGAVWAFSGVHAENWHPVTWLSHMLDCQIYGLHPAGHHLSAVIFHAATVIALFLVLRQMTGALWRSAWVAAVFAIHPLRVESVAWVAERKDVLSGLLFMLTVGAYARYAKHPGARGRYLLVLIALAIGLMCKPMLVTLPLVLLLLDVWPLRRDESLRKLVLEKLPFFALAAASCVATFLMQTKLTVPAGSPIAMHLRLANAAVAAVVYLRQMVWPSDLVNFYPYPYGGIPLGEFVLCGVFLVGLSAMVIWQLRARPWFFVGWFWYLIMLLPVIGIVQVGRQAHADRYTYLPQIGIYLIVAWLLGELVRARPAAKKLIVGAMIGVVPILMICAARQTAYWQDSETLWRRDIANANPNDVAYSNLGGVLLLKGDIDGAISAYQTAVKLHPGVAEGEYDLASALLRKGRGDEALAHFQSALHINPSFAEAHLSLANLLMQKGDVDQAIAHYQSAVQCNPDYADAHLNLATVLMQRGQLDDAITHFEKALQLRPDLAQAHNNLGNILMQRGQIDAAIAHFQKAVELRPNYAKASINLAGALEYRERINRGIPKNPNVR